jgi:hypothetical protein
VETGGVDHHVQMIRPDIMSSQFEKQVTNRTLKRDERNELKVEKGTVGDDLHLQG